MIQIQNQSVTFVGTADGERALTNAGVWSFSGVTYVESGTNRWEGSLRDGGVILVDVGGYMTVTDGPDLVGMGLRGFVLAMVVIGVPMAIRWVWSRTMMAGGLGGQSIE